MKLTIIFLIMFFCTFVYGQPNLPLIRANSKQVDIKDGNFFDKNSWNVSPKIKPDVYTADRTRETKYVTFYTDIDSIRVKVIPGTKFNFIILLNGKDSAYTQIASALPEKNNITESVAVNDTIPFTLTEYNTIKVKAVINNTDTLNFHFDVSSFGFRLVRDAVLKKTSLLANQPDALAGKVKPDFSKLNKVNKLQIGTAVWNNPSVHTALTTAHDMDGCFGYDLFDGKTVEIDYDNNRLVISSHLPKNVKGFTRSKIDFIRSYVCMKGTIPMQNKKCEGEFILDNGSDQAIILDSAWVSKQHFPSAFKVLKPVVLHDPRGVAYESKTVLCPAMQVQKFRQSDIPAIVLGSRNPVGFEVNYFGNDFLKRFNMILDFKNDFVYLKPNKLMSLKYRQSS